jgi:hypothetical protein
MMKFTKSFLLGFVSGIAAVAVLAVVPAIARTPTLKEVEKQIDAFVHAFHCRIASVEDVDIWERKVLVNVKGIRFVMTAYSSETYEICPVGTKPKQLKDLIPVRDPDGSKTGSTTPVSP